MPTQRVRAPATTQEPKGSAQGRLDQLSSAHLSDTELLELVQRQTFRYFWDFAHPTSGLARDRSNGPDGTANHVITVGGSGFGIMAIVVGAERGWITREAAVDHLLKLVGFLAAADSYHGIFPHFLHGETGKTIPLLGANDDGADVVETSFLVAGLLCARQYFDRADPKETDLRRRIDLLWHAAEWDWHTRGGRDVLYWHWSPTSGWSMNHPIRGWNECLITYVMAASAPRHAIDSEVYHLGWAQGPNFRNGQTYYGIRLPLGPAYGGPLFFAHYSFLGLDPRGLEDRYADYWEQNVNHTLVNREHCIRNPNGFKGYGADCWGLTASDTCNGYSAHAPDNDLGVISPTAALSSIPYTPDHTMRALRYFHSTCGKRLWGEFGFRDAFSETADWYAGSHLAIDQGPVVCMIENFRTGLLWKLFMSCPEVKAGLRKLGFKSPHLA